MALPAQLLRELLTVLKSDGARHRVTDKRTGPRVGLRHPVRITPAGPVRWGDPPVWVRNLSANGIGLLAGEAMEPGTEFIVPFQRIDALPLRVLYRATHVARVGEESYWIGGRLVCVISDLATSDPAEKRAAS